MFWKCNGSSFSEAVMAEVQAKAGGRGFAGFERDVARIWLHNASETGPQTRLFRKSFDLDEAARNATLHVFAESRYHIWINGHYLGRGPAFHHPTELLVDSHALPADHLRAGRNVIAVLVQEIHESFHNRLRSGEPGLIAQLDLDGRPAALSDETWRVTDRTGWRADPPRQCWAIDYLEEFDMAASPGPWQTVDFDDGNWQAAQAIRPLTSIPGARFLARPLPGLAHQWRKPARFIGAYSISEPAAPERRFKSTGDLGNFLANVPWTPRPDITIDASANSFTLHPASPSEGLICCFDLGAETVGQINLECDLPGEGTIDIGWSETLEPDGRPDLVRKGVGYVNRIHATQGYLDWSPIQFSAMRYIMLMIRGFDGPVRVRRFGIRASKPDVTWDAGFRSGDSRLTAVFDMCLLSQRVGTQEAQMDCPSREQASYVGDGMITARWFAQLTGDVRHWRYLVHEQFRRQGENGIIRSSIFSGRSDTLVDYVPLAIIGLRDYYLYTRDIDSVQSLIGPARKSHRFFDRHRSAGGLCTWTYRKDQPMATWENLYDPSQPVFGDSEGLTLFIDHPGMGWHNQQEAGIDRRGINAGLNLLVVIAQRALADLEAAIGNTAAAQALRADADHLAKLAHEAFFDPAASLYRDGVLDDERLEQVSEQTNTFAIAARACDDETARSILLRLLKNDDPDISRNGPYFWAYLFPEMMRLGLHDIALDHARAKWGEMIDGGASTLWETFLGDDLDTWCHPWAGAPIDFVLNGLLGLPSAAFDDKNVTLRPRYDLLADAEGSIHTRHGRFEIAWKREGDRAVLRGAVPAGLRASIIRPDGSSIVRVNGEWKTFIDLHHDHR